MEHMFGMYGQGLYDRGLYISDWFEHAFVVVPMFVILGIAGGS